MNPLRRFLPVGLSLCIVLSIRAAPPAVPAGDDVAVQFSLYAWHASTPALRYSPQAKVEALEPFMRSSVQTYAGPATLNFYAPSVQLSPDSPPPPPIATATFPRGATRVTLVTAPVGPRQYQMYAVAEDDASLTPPYIRLHNFTATRLLVAFDANSRVEVPPASTVIIRPEGTATVLRVAQMQNGKWRRLFNNVAELNDEGRKNIILAPAAGRPASLYSLPAWPRPLPEPSVTNPRS